MSACYTNVAMSYLTLILQETNRYQRAISTCSHLAKPNEGESKELQKLFPSCAPSTSKRCLSFDPNRELLGVPDRKKRKKGSTSQGRPVNITVCRLPRFSPFIPRGKVRSNLKEKGRIQTVKLTRHMNPNQAKQMIDAAFFQMSGSWGYLETGQDNQLVEAGEQLPDGNTLCSRRGCLYIVDKDEVHMKQKISYVYDECS